MMAIIIIEWTMKRRKKGERKEGEKKINLSLLLNELKMQ